MSPSQPRGSAVSDPSHRVRCARSPAPFRFGAAGEGRRTRLPLRTRLPGHEPSAHRSSRTHSRVSDCGGTGVHRLRGRTGGHRGHDVVSRIPLPPAHQNSAVLPAGPGPWLLSDAPADLASGLPGWAPNTPTNRRPAPGRPQLRVEPDGIRVLPRSGAQLAHDVMREIYGRCACTQESVLCRDHGGLSARRRRCMSAASPKPVAGSGRRTCRQPCG